jgi:hypothetical protein
MRPKIVVLMHRDSDGRIVGAAYLHWFHWSWRVSGDTVGYVP